MSIKGMQGKFKCDGCLGALVVFFCIGEIITGVIAYFLGDKTAGVCLVNLGVILLFVLGLYSTVRRVEYKVDTLLEVEVRKFTDQVKNSGEAVH